MQRQILDDKLKELSKTKKRLDLHLIEDVKSISEGNVSMIANIIMLYNGQKLLKEWVFEQNKAQTIYDKIWEYTEKAFVK